MVTAVSCCCCLFETCAHYKAQATLFPTLPQHAHSTLKAALPSIQATNTRVSHALPWTSIVCLAHGTSHRVQGLPTCCRCTLLKDLTTREPFNLMLVFYLYSSIKAYYWRLIVKELFTKKVFSDCSQMYF